MSDLYLGLLYLAIYHYLQRALAQLVELRLGYICFGWEIRKINFVYLDWALPSHKSKLCRWHYWAKHDKTNKMWAGPQSYETFSMLISTQHEISTVLLIKTKIVLAFKLSGGVFIMVINVKMPTIVGILTFLSVINFMLQWIEWK